jgi:DNA-binding response OmpR family regulator
MVDCLRFGIGNDGSLAIGRYRRRSRAAYALLMRGSGSWSAHAAMHGGRRPTRGTEGVQRVRVLLADDERLLVDTIADGLRRLAMAVDVCYDGEGAIERLGVNSYDVAVLDRDMPRRSGDEVCRWLVERQLGTRILVLTAAGGIRDRVEGLGLGADDYLTKPFAFAELAARIQALARRPPVGAPPVLDRAGVVLDIPRHRAFRDGRLLELTPKEFAVLSVLMQADGAIVSAEDLLEKAWDENADPFTNAVRVAVMTLRKKLGDPPVVHTVPRVGYRFGQ